MRPADRRNRSPPSTTPRPSFFQVKSLHNLESWQVSGAGSYLLRNCVVKRRRGSNIAHLRDPSQPRHRSFTAPTRSTCRSKATTLGCDVLFVVRGFVVSSVVRAIVLTCFITCRCKTLHLSQSQYPVATVVKLGLGFRLPTLRSERAPSLHPPSLLRSWDPLTPYLRVVPQEVQGAHCPRKDADHLQSLTKSKQVEDSFA